MIALVLGFVLLFLYVCMNSKDTMSPVGILGVIGLLFIAWGTSRYVGTSPKPLWDPN